MSKKVVTCYFSPTSSTKRVTQAVSEGIIARFDDAAFEYDLTLPANRKAWQADTPAIGAEEVLVVGFPVYAGRVPGLFLEEIARLKGEGTPAILVAVYGNRAVDDAVIEASDTLKEAGFEIAGLVSYPCEHSYSSKVGTGRPTADDLKEAFALGDKIGEKLLSGAAPIEVPGNRPYVEYPHGDARPVFTADLCINCLACAAVCPADAIDEDDVSVTEEFCLSCGACVKACPEEARTTNLEALAPVIGMLEGNFTGRQEAALVL